MTSYRQDHFSFSYLDGGTPLPQRAQRSALLTFNKSITDDAREARVFDKLTAEQYLGNMRKIKTLLLEAWRHDQRVDAIRVRSFNDCRKCKSLLYSDCARMRHTSRRHHCCRILPAKVRASRRHFGHIRALSV